MDVEVDSSTVFWEFHYYQRELLTNKWNEGILMQILFFAMTQRQNKSIFFYF